MIKREAYMRRIRPFIGKELIKVLTGIRQSGKSVMLKLIQEELVKQGVSTSQFISLNFEETNNAHLFSAETLHEEMSRRIERIEGKAYLFFDEIQNVTGWEKCVNSLRVKYDCDIYVTGSGANLLSGEYSTYLSGRYVEFVVYPLSFAEFSEMYYKIFPTASQQEVFAKYLFLGGMPYLGKLRYA
ncbi:MAG TPA: AAA family ATPase, partial [Bacillota bacterium]|nr:AAA family ATPase [Bacillota bacterium]